MPRPQSKFQPWQAPVLSFYSRAFYADVASNWTGSGMAYMTLLSTAAWFLTVVFSAVVPCWTTMNNPTLNSFLHQVPTITCNDGLLSIKGKCPHRILDRSGVAWAVFKTDTSQLEQMTSEDPPLVITSDALLVQTRAESKVKKYRFAEILKHFGHIELSGDATLTWIKFALTWLPLIVFFFGLPIVLLSHLLQMLVYALIGMILAKLWKKRHVPFSTSLRLSALAITPNVVLCTFFSGLCLVFMPLRMLETFVAWAPIHNQAFHHVFGIISIAVALLYVLLAVHSIELAEEVLPDQVSNASSG
jgi:hypothetical protein